MIKLNEGELADIMPIEFTRQPEVLGISYALKQAYAEFFRRQLTVLIYCSIDTAPEEVLDMLAIELRVRYYDENFGIDRKRILIKNAIFVGLKDGTKYAVDQVIRTAMGTGISQDWFEYGGDPGHFRVELVADSYDLDKLLNAIFMVKRVSAHLDVIRMLQDVDEPLYFGAVLVTTAEVEIDMEDQEFFFEPAAFQDEFGAYLVDENEDYLLDLEH